jgi:hypothetical protein
MLHILVESNPAANVLLTLLAEEQDGGLVELRVSAPSSSLYGAARTLLGIRSEPVAVVLDAESTDEDAVERRQRSAEEVIGDAAGVAPLRVLVAVPALEALLFRRPDAVRRAFPQASESLVEVGLVSPWNALKRLDSCLSGPTASLHIVRGLNEQDVAALRAESPIKELLEFLGELQKDGTATAAAGA